MITKKLQEWCESLLNTSLHMEAFPGDAGFRRYFRLRDMHSAQSYVAAIAPPATEKNYEFVAVAQALQRAGILAPEVLAVDYARGFILLTDLGSQMLLPALDENTVDDYYRQALDVALAMWTVDSSDLALYDEQLLCSEMLLFPQWFIAQLLNYTLSDDERAMLQDVFELLVQEAQAQPQGFVHRDFHSRNIMLTKGAIAVIDFQDAVRGPLCYDCVSLLRDCYIAWSQERVFEHLEYFYRSARAQGFLGEDVCFATFKRWFDWMGLQRHIKVLGIFARLSLRDGKDAYLYDLPLVIHYLVEILGRYPDNAQLSTFLTWFNDKLKPLIEQQFWYIGKSV